ncbi:MAG: hypothetical protein WCG80_11480 [Spirochaetales bacterium]
MLYHCEDDNLLVKVGPGPQLMISRDCGTTWVPLTPESASSSMLGPYEPQVHCRAETADGRRIVAGENPGSIWISNDAGTTWERKTVGPQLHRRHWVSVAISADERRISGVVRLTREGLAVVYVSDNWGESWYRAREFSITDEPTQNAS